MPTRKSDGTEEEAVTPETEGREPGADLARPDEEPLPPAGAESVRDSEGSAPEEAPAPETVSVDEQPEPSLDAALTVQERPEPTPPPAAGAAGGGRYRMRKDTTKAACPSRPGR